MQSSGLVYVDGSYTTGALFQNPFYATGYPITEAYWTRVEVAGSHVGMAVNREVYAVLAGVLPARRRRPAGRPAPA